MARRSKRQVGGSLDSLLDTMTNVVGILVIVLIVTQLGVRDAVKQISVENPIDPKLIEQKEAEAAEVRAEHDELAASLKALQESKKADPRVEIARLKRAIRDHQANIPSMTRSREQEIAKSQEKRQEQLDRLAEFKKKEDELAKRLTDAQDSLARLRAQLESTPQRKTLSAKVVNLPNPRPAPKEAKPITFLCREGRIFFVNTPTFQDRAQKRAAFIIRQRNLDRDPKAGIDGEILTKEFNRRPLRDRDFDLGFAVHGGRWPKIVLNRQNSGGETAKEVQSDASYYQQGMTRIDPRKYYAQFLVWPDSFETYLAARQIASEHGILAGWVPQDRKEEHTISLGGPIRIGPPPPPRPKPPPGQEPPKPPPKPPPIDTID